MEPRIPPHSVQSEQAVIGALIIDGKAWDSVEGILTADDFYRADHRVIFAAQMELGSQNKPIDVVTVSDLLEARGQLEQAGGLAYLGAIARDTPSSAAVKQYAQIVRDKAVLRRLIAVGSQIASDAWDAGEESIDAVVDKAQSSVMTVADTASEEPQLIATHLRAFVDEMERRNERGGELIGLSTGLIDLDAKTYGLQPGDLIILAARPSMGKTALASNIAEHAALNGKAVAMFSAEMPTQQLVERMTSSLGRIPFAEIRSGALTEEHWLEFAAATHRMKGMRLVIDDGSAPSVSDVRSRSRRVKREYGLDLIVVDYLQLMRGTGDNRTQEIGSISRGLKGIAKELGVPVIALSQLNRGLESRNNKRPKLSDLRDSGEIEQDADHVWFLYRDEIYDEDTTRKGCAELIIAKQRNGELGLIGLAAKLDHMRFESLDGPLPELRKDSTSTPMRGGFRGSHRREAPDD